MRKFTGIALGFVMVIGLLVLATSGQAALITTTNGTALITAGAGTITVTLTDTAVNPTSVDQNISGLVFSTDSGSSVAASLKSPEVGVQYVNIADGGTYALTSGLAKWSYSGTSSQYVLIWNGTGSTVPAYTIVGVPGGGNYTNANGSLAGNNPHNPFIYHEGTFVLNIAGITANTVISNGTILFGTSGEIPPPTTVPEAGALLMFGTGLIGLVGYRRVRRMQ